MLRYIGNDSNNNVSIPQSVQNDEPIISSEFIKQKKQEANSKSLRISSFLPIDNSENNEFYAYKQHLYNITLNEFNTGGYDINGIYGVPISNSHANNDKSYFQILRNLYSSSKTKAYTYVNESAMNNGGLLISFPINKVGEGIQKNSSQYIIDLQSTGYNDLLNDDGNGNLFGANTNITGSIFYGQGMIFLPNDYVNNIYWDDITISILSIDIFSTIYYSTIPIREHIWNCKIPAGQLNNSTNKTSYVWSGSIDTGSKILNNSGSSFQPYVTSIGLYNEKNELMAIAKLAKPLKKPKDQELTISIRIDT